ncbi:hypothetical protein [Planococcus beigongshangi]|uniref:hypothetical protein n=1 Tax=Planococcus beigongshangi TaxID=2782536 RepID=UPI00193BA20F|nr:hypothetical protein [Planococcus beigongshangi]
MRVEVCVVPPGGGETNYMIGLAENTVYMPRVGEYILIKEEDGGSAFLVRNILHSFEMANVLNVETSVIIEAEPVILPEIMSSPKHQKLCLSLNVTLEYPNSVY